MRASTLSKAIFTCLILSLVGIGQVKAGNTTTTSPQTGYVTSPAITTPQVTSVSTSSASEQVSFSGRTGLGVPVPFVSPMASASAIAFDVGPTVGAQEQWGIGVAWIDICDSLTTCTGSSGNTYESLRIGIHQNGDAFIGSAFGGTGAYHNLTLQNKGGTLILGATTGSNLVQIPSIKATTGTRYVCVDSSGNIFSSASPCSSASAQTSTGSTISPNWTCLYAPNSNSTSSLCLSTANNLVTSAGSWTFSNPPITNIGGYDISLNTNSNVVGSAVLMLVYQGQLYAQVINTGAWWVWNGSSWTASGTP